MAKALLDVRNLTISFPDSSPVRELSFTANEGETVAIVGESGSGKSLTALSLMRLLPNAARISSGSITFAGTDLVSLPDRDMRHHRGRDIAMVFQEPMTSLNPVMTIGGQISEVLRLHSGFSARQARSRAIEMLDLARIPEPARQYDEYPHRLSGGMRQRVMIAIAAACQPKLLIADEPTTALDVTIQAQILDLLDRLRRELRLSLLLITHDLGVVGQWADRVVVMYAGRKVEEAPADELFARPLHPYTRGLLAASPRLNGDRHYREAALTEIHGSIASASRESGCPFLPRCPIGIPTCRARFPDLLTASAARHVACPVTIVEERSHGAAVGIRA
ncbi:MAG: ABC transporter ATP-binding protein [Methylobacteriaceae bacterium]|nr:ABC transporter ATP-binding protein [Methylobacteriaceae bacterium]